MKQGAWYEYWEDGKISSVMHYKNGKYDGEYMRIENVTYEDTI